MFASTPDQEEKVEELAQYFYSEILPLYFSDREIMEFDKQKVLHTTKEQYEKFNTLGEAFRVITSLQTIISILETDSLSEEYSEIFQKNAQTLREYGLYFPFHYHQFLHAGFEEEREYISMFSKAANSFLV